MPNTPYQKLLKEVLQRNEANASQAYQLSHAGTGTSGWTFGYNQMDLGAGTGTGLMKDILDHEYGTGYYESISDGLTQKMNQSSISTATKEKVNTALNSEYGRERIDQSFNHHLQDSEEYISNLESRLGVKFTLEAKIALGDLNNQIPIQRNGSTESSLKNAATNDGIVTLDEVKQIKETYAWYKSEEGKKDFDRRMDNIEEVLEDHNNTHTPPQPPQPQPETDANIDTPDDITPAEEQEQPEQKPVTEEEVEEPEILTPKIQETESFLSKLQSELINPQTLAIVVARLAMGEDLDYITADLTARAAIRIGINDFAQAHNIPMDSLTATTAQALGSYAATIVITNAFTGGMNSNDYALAAANISIQTITQEVVKHYGGQALTQQIITEGASTASGSTGTTTGLSPAGAGVVAAITYIGMRIAKDGMPDNSEEYEDMAAGAASAFTVAMIGAMIGGPIGFIAGLAIGIIAGQPLTNAYNSAIDDTKELVQSTIDGYKTLFDGDISGIEDVLKANVEFFVDGFERVVNFWEDVGKSLGSVLGLRDDLPPPPPLFKIEQKEDGTGQIIYSLNDGRILTTRDGFDDDAVGTNGAETLVGADGKNQLYGFDGDDYLEGREADDTIFAGNGNDEILAGAGNDFIDGEDGNDIIQGNDGDDIISAGAGDDIVYGDSMHEINGTADGKDNIDGGLGNDTIYAGGQDDVVTGGKGNDIIFGQGGNDTLDGSFGNDTIEGGIGNDTISGGQDGVLILSNIKKQIKAKEEELSQKQSAYDALDENRTQEEKDNLQNEINNLQSQLEILNNNLTAALEDINEVSGNDNIKGGEGDDKIYAFSGDDTIDGGNGNNIILAGYGSDTITTGSGNDVVIADEDSQYYKDAIGDENITPEEFNSAFVDGNDTISTGDGDDYVELASGNDKIYSGDGNDTIYNKGANATIYSHTGNDEVVADGGNNFIKSQDGNDKVETADGDDYIDGGNGDDRLSSSGGNNEIYGEDGNDTINSGNGNDKILGGAGNDIISSTGGNNYLDGQEGDDYIIGGTGEDTILTGEGHDNIFAGGGNDTITTNSQTAKLIGGDGNDTYFIQNLDGNVTIEDSGNIEDIDTIEFDRKNLQNLKMERNGGNLLIKFTGSAGIITITNQFKNGNASRIESLKFADTLLNITSFITGTHGDDAITGTSNDEVILGLGGKDVIFAGDGDDTVDGGVDDDVIYGEGGNDILKGSENDDILFGGTGNDTLIGNQGNDELTGGEGSDTFIFTKESNSDTVTDFEIGKDKIDLTAYGDKFSSLKAMKYFSSTVTQNGANTNITLTNNTNITVNNQQADALLQESNFMFDIKESSIATDGNDILTGSTDNDTILDGKGHDILTGGSGRDTFKLTKNDGDIDTITDFDISKDKVDLTNLDSYVDLLQLDIEEKNGDTILKGDNGQRVILEGIKADQLNNEHFNFAVFNGLPQVQRYSGHVDYDFGKDEKVEGQSSTFDGIFGTGVDESVLKDAIASGIDFNSLNFHNSENIFNEGVSHILANNEYWAKVGGKHKRWELQRNTNFYGNNEGWKASWYKSGKWGWNVKWNYDQGNDRMYGAWWSENIYAGSGNDEVYAGAGNDNVYGGTGNDYLNGQDGNDRIYGENGNDFLLGGTGNDHLDGGNGNDYLNGEWGDDTMYGGNGSDKIEDYHGNNILSGQMGNDMILAGSGNDQIFGGNGNDYIVAGAGDDYINGSSDPGNDYLINFTYKNFAPGAGGWSSNDRYPRELADVNGDGLQDVVGFGHSGVYVALANGDGTFQNIYTATSQFTVAGGGWYSNNRYVRQLGDVNGDGRDDIVGFGHAGVYVALANENGTFNNANLVYRAFAPGAGGWSYNDRYLRELADVNGDGLQDIVGFAHHGVHVSLANGDGTFAPMFKAHHNYSVGTGGWYSNNRYVRQLGDINGDGREDLVGFGYAGVYVSLANEDGTFGVQKLVYKGFSPGAGGWSYNDRYTRELADVNGDGLKDIVGFAHSGIYIALAKGDGTFHNAYKASSTFDVDSGWHSNNVYVRQLGDINGDGKDDIVGFGHSGIYTGIDNGSINDNDYIDAGTGNDTVIDRGGDNVVYLGEGNDRAEMGFGNDFIDGGTGQDRIYAGAGDDTVLTGAGNDYAVADGGNDMVEALSGLNWIHGGEGNDKLEGGEDHDIIYGGSGEDEIYGNDGSDLIVAGTNDDKVHGGNDGDDISLGQGNDTAYGDAGDDLIRGESGDDILYGNDGKDKISGGEDNDTIYGGSDNDLLVGDSGDDTIYGEEGSDFIYGGSGNDKLIGGNGKNILQGDEGDDVYVFNKDDKFRDIIVGFEDGDKVDLSTYTDYSSILQLRRDSSVLFGSDVIDLGNGNKIAFKDSKVSTLKEKHFYLNNYYSSVKEIESNPESETSYFHTDGYFSYESDMSVSKNNWMTGNNIKQDGGLSLNVKRFTIAQSGNAWNNAISGNENSEWLLGGGGDDYIDGKGGNDIIDGGTGNDIIYAGNGFDIVTAGEGNDLVYGGDGNDIITGNDGNDLLVGDGGDDKIWGGNNNDFISGGTGNDGLYGDNGEDYIEGNDGDDTIHTGNDRDITYGGKGNDTIHLGTDNDFASGGSGRDLIYGESGNDRIFGDSGHDYLHGGDGNDIIHGGFGNDIIYAGGGTYDALYGGDGSDILYGGAGDVSIYAGSGDDVIYGGKGKSYIRGNEGRDIFSFESLESSTSVNIDKFVDFTQGEDVFDLSGICIESFDDLTVTHNGGETYVDDNNSNFVFKLSGTHLLAESDFMFAGN